MTPTARRCLLSPGFTAQTLKICSTDLANTEWAGTLEGAIHAHVIARAGQSHGGAC